jgi:NIMA-interacting peptidyl-prolyl cis-trans isomerase 1
MRRTLWIVLVVTLGTACEDKYAEMQKQAAASASAAAAASAAALASALAAQSASAAAAGAAPKKEEAPPEWITAQHVLIAYKGAAKCPRNVTRTKEDARKLAAEVHGKAALAGKMDFSELAQLYSDDPNGKERQGSLGKIKRENVVKEFADVAFALHVDEVSQVVETQFGFHVIKRNQ